MNNTMKNLFFAGIILLTQLPVFAQIEQTEEVKKLLTIETKDTVAWIKGGVLAVGINEGFLHNWPAGGELASITINGQFSGFFNRIYHRHIWANNLDMTYGLFYAYSNRFVPRKLDDRLDFTSKYGLQLHPKKHIFFSTLLNFRTQLTKGFDYSLENYQAFPTSNFLSPAYITLAVGLEYREANKFSVFFSPIAARVTLADKYYTNLRPEGMFGIENGKTSRFELGAYFSGRYSTEINKNFLFKTRLDLYSNYLAKDVKDDFGNVVKKNNPGNIDVLLDNFLSLKVAKFISINLGATFIYDNDVPYQNTTLNPSTAQIDNKNEPGEGLGWWQTKQILSVGFEYRW